MPTLPASSKIVELPSVELLVQIGMKSVVPEPENFGELTAAPGVATVLDVDVVDELLSLPVPDSGTRMNADGGSPPIVAASDAFKA
jgi:hypothetical protein